MAAVDEELQRLRLKISGRPPLVLVLSNYSINANKSASRALFGEKLPMNKKVSNRSADRKNYQPVRGEPREYSRAQEFFNNLPYMAMMVLGAAIFLVGFESLMWKWIGAGVYLIYGVAGAFWIMLFVCPYCMYWNTRSCPCGYGSIAAKLRLPLRLSSHPCLSQPNGYRQDEAAGEQKLANRFNQKFKRHIPVIVPLWFIPILAGVPLVVRDFSWLLLVLLAAFALDAFVLLPLFSTKYGCRGCPQKDLCPWMGRKSRTN